MGIIDLVVVVACWLELIQWFFTFTSYEMRSVGSMLKLLRLCRIANIIKLQWYFESGGWIQTSKAVSNAIRLFVLMFGAAGILLFFDDMAEEFVNPFKNVFGNANKISWFNSFYFACTTVMTVGYGDITPKTVRSRMVVTAVQMASYAIMAYNITILLEDFTQANLYRKHIVPVVDQSSIIDSRQDEASASVHGQ